MSGGTEKTEVETDKTSFLGPFRALRLLFSLNTTALIYQILCGRRDSNPHALRHQILSLARLPISPRPRYFFIKNDFKGLQR